MDGGSPGVMGAGVLMMFAMVVIVIMKVALLGGLMFVGFGHDVFSCDGVGRGGAWGMGHEA